MLAPQVCDANRRRLLDREMEAGLDLHPDLERSSKVEEMPPDSPVVRDEVEVSPGR